MEKQNTLAEVARNFYDGDLDIDVYDKDIDMIVAFVYDFKEEPTDYYEKFLKYLADNVQVIHIGSNGITCDFSKLFKEAGEKLQKFIIENEWQSGEFDDDEAYYDMVLCLESLISGNSSESTYKDLLEILQS